MSDAKETASKLSTGDRQLVLEMKDKPLLKSFTWRANKLHEKGLTTWSCNGWILSTFGKRVLENL